jgi:CRISPR-associated endonuclease/helicase Cas3
LQEAAVALGLAFRGLELHNVQALAGKFAAEFGAHELGGLIGLLHDLGKYDEKFVARLTGQNVRHDHSTAGACISAERYGGIGKLLAYAIAGHHAGFANGVRDERNEAARRSLRASWLPSTEHR